MRCNRQLGKHVMAIIQENGEMKKKESQIIGRCFYKSIRSFAKCVKKAPAIPAIMEYKHSNDLKELNEFVNSFRDEAENEAKAFSESAG